MKYKVLFTYTCDVGEVSKCLYVKRGVDVAFDNFYTNLTMYCVSYCLMLGVDFLKILDISRAGV